MNDEPAIEELIMTLDLCEHYLPKHLPSIHRTHLRRIRHLLRELAGTAQRAAPVPSDQGNDDDRA